MKFLVDSARGAVARARKLELFQNLQPKPTKTPAMPVEGEYKDDTDKGGKKGGGKKDNKGKGGKGAKDGGTQGPRKINGKTLPCVRSALGRECPYGDKCLLPHCKDGNHVPTDAHPAGTDMNTICQISDIPCK